MASACAGASLRLTDRTGSCHDQVLQFTHMSKPFFSRFRWTRPIILAAILPSAFACTEKPVKPESRRQVIIGFTTPTDGKAHATLDAIEKAAGTRASYVSALSDRSYTYLLDCPAGDPGCELVIKALRHTSGIDYIQADQTRNLP